MERPRLSVNCSRQGSTKRRLVFTNALHCISSRIFGNTDFRRAEAEAQVFAIYAERNRLERFGGCLGFTDAQRRAYGPVTPRMRLILGIETSVLPVIREERCSKRGFEHYR